MWQARKYHAILVRTFVNAIRHLCKKPIWIISDRLSRADDNGEAFFAYLREFKKGTVNSFFVMTKDCDDYK